MTSRHHQLIVLRPSEAFGSPQIALRLGELPNFPTERLRYFQLPLIAVVVTKNGLPHAVACNFLLEKALLSRGITGDTARGYGEALCDWLDFLYLSRCQPSDATEERLGLYRLHLLSASNGGRKLQATTANHRLVVAAEFQRWGQRSRTFVSPLGAFLENSHHVRGAQSRSSARWRNPNSYLATADRRLPKILTQEEIVRLFKVAPRPFDLMFRWALATGMRRLEICELRISQLPSPEAVARGEGGLLTMDVRRKGGHLQSLAVPSGLVEQTSWYVLTERSRGNRATTDHVFLGRGCRQISRQRLSRVFRECANAIGSTATLHHLRHTFAVNVLGALDRYEGDGRAMNPLKCVQVLLGLLPVP